MKTQDMLLSFTPDPDDAFAWWGIVSGRIPIPGFTVHAKPRHIQEANEACVRGELDVAAVSAAAYPFFSNDYWFLSVGTSVGRGYGPVLVTQASEEIDLRRDIIAVPGNMTTGAMLLRVLYPNAKTIQMSCDEIAPAVLSGRVSAGVLIHEELLNWERKGLALYSCLGAQWLRQTGLPIPVGLIVVHKRHGLAVARSVADALRKSITAAHGHRREALAWAMRYSSQAADGIGAQFIDMFTNEDCLCLADDCAEALDKLYTIAVQRKLIPVIPELLPVTPDQNEMAVA